MKYVVAVLIAGVLFGTTGTAQVLGTDGTNPISVGSARLVFGGGLLALVSWWLARRRSTMTLGELDLPPDPHAGPLSLEHRIPTRLLLIVGGVTVIAYQPLFFGGAQMNGVAIGTVVALGSAPVFTGIVAGLINRAFPGKAWAIATTGSIVGVGMLALARAEDAGTGGPLGLLVSAAAGLSYASYAVCIKMLIARGWPSSTAVGALFGIAAVGSIPLLLLSGPNWFGTMSGLTMVIWLALVTTVVANLLFGFGLVGLNAATVSTLTLAEPLTASLLGVFVLREHLNSLALAGLAILGAAIAYLAIASGRPGSDTVARP